MITATRITAIAFAIGIATTGLAEAGSKHKEQQLHQHYMKRTVTTVTVEMDEKLRNKTIPLRRLLDLDQRYHGYKVKKVIVHLKPRNRNGRISLFADDQRIDRVYTRDADIVTLKPQGREILGHTTKRLQLVLDGRAHIKSIDVQIRPTKLAWKAKLPRSKHDRHAKRVDYPCADFDRDGFSRRLAYEIARVLAERKGQNL